MAPLPKSTTPAPSPRPEPPPRPSFPTSACGAPLAASITATAARIQAAPELIAHHLLTLAAMAAQRLVSVRLPTGPIVPVSSYFLTIAGSGEGRSAAEAMCVGPVRFWQQRFTDGAEATAAAESMRHLAPKVISLGVIPSFTALLPAREAHPRGRPPAARPFEFDNVFLSPHRAGITDRYNRYARFGRRSGLFAGVAADLLTPSTARRNEADSLSALWDGGIIVSGLQEAAVAPRLSTHLVATPGEGFALLRAPEVAESGLLGRLLAVQPASCIGTRVFRESDGTPPPAVVSLHETLTALYEREATCETRVVALDDAARAEWFAFACEAEAKMAEDGAFALIRPLAGRLAEHAVRLAAIIALIEDPDLTEITPPLLARGIALARFYADEALRLSTVRVPSLSERDSVAALQVWLERKYAGQDVSLREVYCFGPPELRSAAMALQAMRQLEVLGVTVRVPQEGAKTGGQWHVAKPGESGAVQPSAA